MTTIKQIHKGVTVTMESNEDKSLGKKREGLGKNVPYLLGHCHASCASRLRVISSLELYCHYTPVTQCLIASKSMESSAVDGAAISPPLHVAFAVPWDYPIGSTLISSRIFETEGPCKNVSTHRGIKNN